MLKRIVCKNIIDVKRAISDWFKIKSDIALFYINKWIESIKCLAGVESLVSFL